jgi:predicted dehydrogenase
MLAREELDLVVVVTRSDQHCAMVCDCLAAGRHVLVTKPWAANTKEADQMIAAAKGSKGLLLPWLPARWGSDLLRLKELLAEGAIGQVFQIRRSEYTFGLRNDWQIWQKYAGGYLLNWGPHLVDQPIQLAGGQVRTAYAQLRQINNPGDVEDVYHAVLTLDNGIIINSEFNIAAGDLPSWVVQGDRGTIIVRGDQLEIQQAAFSAPEGASYRSQVQLTSSREVISGDRYGDNFTVYRHLARSLRGEEKYQVTPASAKDLTVTLDAIRQSSFLHQVVNIK